MSAKRLTYIDSSAVVKLVVREPESAALRKYVQAKRTLVSSALARAEVMRAVLQLGRGALRTAQDVLGRIELVRINNRVLAGAGILEPHQLRTLDAIHLATASLFGDTLSNILSYDDRFSDAATQLGWSVIAPA